MASPSPAGCRTCRHGFMAGLRSSLIWFGDHSGRHRFQPHVLVSALSPTLGPHQGLEKSLGEALYPCPPPSCMAGLGTGMGSGRVADELTGWPPVPWGGRGTPWWHPYPSRAGSTLKSMALQQ